MAKKYFLKRFQRNESEGHNVFVIWFGVSI